MRGGSFMKILQWLMDKIIPEQLYIYEKSTQNLLTGENLRNHYKNTNEQYRKIL